MTKPRKSAAGRPRAIKETELRKLEQAFLMGCSDKEACLFADVAPSTLYKYCNENPAFAERKETLKQNPVMQARSVVLDAIQIDRDVNVANKLLDRKEGSKMALTGGDGGPVRVETTRIELVRPHATDA